MTEKKAEMVLQVDLQCPCCYKKIQKILCKIPEITHRAFDEKANMVIITVECCSPENIRDKLCCKGGKIIKSIEIKKPPKPPGDKPPPVTDKPNDPPKPKPQKETPPPEPTPCPPVVVVLPTVHPANPCCGPCREGHAGGPCYCGHGFPPPPPQPCYCGKYGPRYVYGRPFYITRCDCFSEENSTGCTIM